MTLKKRLIYGLIQLKTYISSPHNVDEEHLVVRLGVIVVFVLLPLFSIIVVHNGTATVRFIIILILAIACCLHSTILLIKLLRLGYVWNADELAKQHRILMFTEMMVRISEFILAGLIFLPILYGAIVFLIDPVAWIAILLMVIINLLIIVVPVALWSWIDEYRINKRLKGGD